MRPFYYSLALLALAACYHEAPFTPARQGTESPFTPTVPVRLTYNPGLDRDAVWLPDESGLVYSADLADHAGDRCLVQLPPDGGRITRTWCPATLASRDSLNWFDAAAVSPGGWFALLRTSRPPGQATPRFKDLAVAVPDSVGLATSVQDLPGAIGGSAINDIQRVRWQSDSVLIYRAGFGGDICIGPGPRCPMAFVRSGFFLVRHALGSAPVPIPGTDEASSVALDPGGDAAFFTRNGDSRLYRIVLSTGAVSVVYDNGVAGTIRDVQVRGTSAVVVSGGGVTLIDPAISGLARPVQYDLGGALVLVDLATGGSTQVNPNSGFYSNPAWSPSGRLVAESNGDLWMFQVP